jgi:hypothetical protein
MAQLAGRVAGGSTGPRVPSLIAGMAWCWSGWVGEDGDGSQAVAFGCTVQALRNTMQERARHGSR